MFNNVSEKQMHRVRWILTLGWLILIALIAYDPISPWLTEPDNLHSPFRKDPSVCVKLQGVCIVEQPHSLAAQLFWAIIVPLGAIVLLVFGHELWRRICPLSFLSQIPRALKIQRKQKQINPKTGKISYKLVKINKNSWLSRNYLYFQFGLLYLGICARLLFVNSVGWVLALFLLSSIGLSILVGYLYEGKTWCNYFCPMAPVQRIYGEPRGLLASTAHESPSKTITQSMCRITDKKGKEQSACVACQSPCIDIDSERSYWDGIDKPDRKLLYYGYIGLVFSFYFYYYLYAGNWDYYFSGAWTHEENLASTIFNPGFYIFDTAIPIPKLVAVPLTLGFFTLSTYWLGLQLEKAYKVYLRKKNHNIPRAIIQHRLFTLCTFFVFNLFFFWGGRPSINLLPSWVVYFLDVFLLFVSTLWLYRTWGRTPELYSQESLAIRLRKQLKKLDLDVARYLEGGSIDNLKSNEVYVIAKILPGFTHDKKMQAYKGILKEFLEEGYVNSANSLEILKQMRIELNMSDRDHEQILTELGVENSHLFDPNQQRTREDFVRLQGFRNRVRGLVKPKRRRSARGLGRELLQVVKKEKSIGDVLDREKQAIDSLSLEYDVTPAEKAKILREFTDEPTLTE